MYFIFFSRWQKNRNRESGCRATFAKLKNGRIVEYTEMCREERPSGNVDDYILLGKGDFDHVDGTSKDTVETKGTISRRKFDSLKLLPIEKFKLKSPKNIFKKRPYGYF